MSAVCTSRSRPTSWWMRSSRFVLTRSSARWPSRFLFPSCSIVKPVSWKCMRTSDREELLKFYRDELSYLRRMGREFKAQYAKLAARLEISDNECSDPHVERLIQSFAFLTARLQLNL